MEENNNKRPLKDTSPEIDSSLRNKKHLPEKTITMSGDTFSWSMFEEKMSKMLETVAKKSDLQQLQSCIDEVKRENERLRNDMAVLKRKVEIMDKESRRSNIVVSGIKANSHGEAKEKFVGLCTNTIKTKVGIVRMIPMKNTSEYVVELESSIQATNILVSSNKLRGTGVFIQRDYTPEERTHRYHFRQLKKVVQQHDKNITCAIKGTTLWINNKFYTWKADSVVASKEDDKQFLVNLLMKTKAKYNVTVDTRKLGKTIINAGATNALTQVRINAEE